MLQTSLTLVVFYGSNTLDVFLSKTTRLVSRQCGIFCSRLCAYIILSSLLSGLFLRTMKGCRDVSLSYEQFISELLMRTLICILLLVNAFIK